MNLRGSYLNAQILRMFFHWRQNKLCKINRNWTVLRTEHKQEYILIDIINGIAGEDRFNFVTVVIRQLLLFWTWFYQFVWFWFYNTQLKTALIKISLIAASYLFDLFASESMITDKM